MDGENDRGSRQNMYSTPPSVPPRNGNGSRDNRLTLENNSAKTPQGNGKTATSASATAGKPPARPSSTGRVLDSTPKDSVRRHRRGSNSSDAWVPTELSRRDSGASSKSSRRHSTSSAVSSLIFDEESNVDRSVSRGSQRQSVLPPPPPLPNEERLEHASGRVKVFTRFRPEQQTEIERGGDRCIKIDEEGHSVEVYCNRSMVENRRYTFDKILGPESSQQETYATAVRPIVQGLFSGFNGAVLAYGQTSSGKTYTMEGNDITDPEQMGVIPRMIEDIFGYIEQSDENINFTIRVSMVEIYCEQIRDLLDPEESKSRLEIHEDKSRGVYISGAVESNVASPEEIISALHIGSSHRATSSTSMNQDSSRSHSIFILSLTQKNLTEMSTKTAKLFLVDLAGSEKVEKSKVTGQSLKEAQKINLSLSSLGNVINALTEKKKAHHVPYRDSKLTRVLQEALGGNSRTALILNCSPSSYNVEETLSTLRFGNRAKKLVNTPKVNEEYSANEAALKQEISRLELQVQELREELSSVKGKDDEGASSRLQFFKDELEKEQRNRRKLVAEKDATIDYFKSQYENIKIDKQQEVDALTKKLKEYENELKRSQETLQDKIHSRDHEIGRLREELDEANRTLANADSAIYSVCDRVLQTGQPISVTHPPDELQATLCSSIHPSRRTHMQHVNIALSPFEDVQHSGSESLSYLHKSLMWAFEEIKSYIQWLNDHNEKEYADILHAKKNLKERYQGLVHTYQRKTQQFLKSVRVMKDGQCSLEKGIKTELRRNEDFFSRAVSRLKSSLRYKDVCTLSILESCRDDVSSLNSNHSAIRESVNCHRQAMWRNFAELQKQVEHASQDRRKKQSDLESQMDNLRAQQDNWAKELEESKTQLEVKDTECNSIMQRLEQQTKKTEELKEENGKLLEKIQESHCSMEDKIRHLTDKNNNYRNLMQRICSRQQNADLKRQFVELRSELKEDLRKFSRDFDQLSYYFGQQAAYMKRAEKDIGYYTQKAADAEQKNRKLYSEQHAELLKVQQKLTTFEKECENKESRIEQILSEKNEIHSAKDKQIEDLLMKLNELRKKLDEEQRSHEATTVRYKEIETTLNHCKSREEELMSRLNSTNTDLDEHRKLSEENAQSLNSLKAESQERIDELQRKLFDEQKLKNEYSRNFQEISLRNRQAEDRLHSLSRQVEQRSLFVEDLRMQLTRKREKISALASGRQDFETKLQRICATLRRSNTEINTMRMSRHELKSYVRKEAEANKGSLGQLLSAVNKICFRNSECEKKINHQDVKLASLEDQNRQISEKCTDLQNQKVYQEDRIQNLEMKLSSTSESAEGNMAYAEQLEREKLQLREDITQKTECIEKLQSELNNSKQTLKDTKAQLEDTEKDKEVLKRDFDQQRKREEELNSRISALEVCLCKCKADCQSLENRIEESEHKCTIAVQSKDNEIESLNENCRGKEQKLEHFLLQSNRLNEDISKQVCLSEQLSLAVEDWTARFRRCNDQRWNATQQSRHLKNAIGTIRHHLNSTFEAAEELKHRHYNLYKYARKQYHCFEFEFSSQNVYLERLVRQIHCDQKSLKRLEDRNKMLEEDNVSLQDRCSSFEEKIGNIQKVVSTLQQELDISREKNVSEGQEKEENIAVLQQEAEQTKQLLADSEKEKQKWEQNVKELESHCEKNTREYHEQLQQVKEINSQLQGELDKLKETSEAQLSSKNEDLETLRVAFEERENKCQEEIRALNQSLGESGNYTVTLENQVSELNEKYMQRQPQLEELQTTVEKAHLDAISLKSYNDDILKQLEQIQQEKSQLETNNEHLRRSLSHNSVALERVQMQFADVEGNLFSKCKRISALELQSKKAVRERNQKEIQLQALREELASVDTSCKKEQESNNNLRDEINTLQKKIEFLQDQASQFQNISYRVEKLIHGDDTVGPPTLTPEALIDSFQALIYHVESQSIAMEDHLNKLDKLNRDVDYYEKENQKLKEDLDDRVNEVVRLQMLLDGSLNEEELPQDKPHTAKDRVQALKELKEAKDEVSSLRLQNEELHSQVSRLEEELKQKDSNAHPAQCPIKAGSGEKPRSIWGGKKHTV